MKVDIFSEKTAKILSWVGLVLIVLGAVVFIIFRSWEFSLTLNEEKVGQFGDFIGGVVGTILAFVGVILYYIALTEQRKDIAINRKTLETQVKALNQQIEEFKAQTKEMQDTRTVYEEQTKLYREQTNYYQQQVRELKNQTKISNLHYFNSEFYSLLNVYINNRESSILSLKGVFDELKKSVASYNRSLCNRHSYLIREYTNLYYSHSVLLSVYFKTIYRFLKMIDTSNIEQQHKQRYAKTLRSQLTEVELLILYYNYYSDFGEKVRMLAIKYDLLKHLNFMDKFEMDLSKFNPVRSTLLSCLDKISNVLDNSIKQSKDLESENNIVISDEILFIDIPTKYYLEINEECFIFRIEPTKAPQYDEEDYKNVVLMFLYEYFFLSKFKNPVDNVFENTIIDRDKTFEISYKSKLENIF